ncbi:hypothetical protein BP6252_09747 [Coleophoma cylindrospora]|uniref:Uncharacterized protein n=1 Tax=Coleophoma cylindrospora TaxID=1849047 RepID=A0A3D8QWE7_9HELO|nr:hypothetical protein BP6252_09747 [Coleophoma cylindrospora]
MSSFFKHIYRRVWDKCAEQDANLALGDGRATGAAASGRKAQKQERREGHEAQGPPARKSALSTPDLRSLGNAVPPVRSRQDQPLGV